MLLQFYLAFLSSTSASESAGCSKKDGFSLFESENPVKGSCVKSGLGWKGRDRYSFPDGDEDQFFTKWTDLFLQPECVDKIEVHISDTDGREEHQIQTIQDFSQIDAAEKNPSNTILITDQPEDKICKLEWFQSRLVFFPKFFDQGNIPCFELKRKIKLDPHLSLATFFLNNKGPVIETAKNDSFGMTARQLHTGFNNPVVKAYM